jgi:hypothetical protein
MDVVIVYESIFGNTRMIAEAVADGVHEADPGGHVAVLPVAEATPDRTGDPALVIVGGPTHVRSMSRATGRQRAVQGAAAQAEAEDYDVEPGAAGPGVRDWLDALPRPQGERAAAAFDTRLPHPLAGGAAQQIAKGLRRHGYTVVASPAGFVVEGAHGPLRAGEPNRARAWARELVVSLQR